MNINELRDLVFESLAEPICQLGCAGPPTCKQEGCDSKGQHDTGLSMVRGVVYVEIDDARYRIDVSKVENADEHG